MIVIFVLMKVFIINGPNLNLLGTRQPEIYGDKTFEDHLNELRSENPELEILYFQSNVEGEIVTKIQEVGMRGIPIVLNAAAYTHTSVAIADAIAAIDAPVIEVHISNVYAREEYRHESKMAKHCKGVIAGFGMDSYKLAIEALKL